MSGLQGSEMYGNHHHRSSLQRVSASRMLQKDLSSRRSSTQIEAFWRYNTAEDKTSKRTGGSTSTSPPPDYTIFASTNKRARAFWSPRHRPHFTIFLNRRHSGSRTDVPHLDGFVRRSRQTKAAVWRDINAENPRRVARE